MGDLDLTLACQLVAGAALVVLNWLGRPDSAKRQSVRVQTAIRRALPVRFHQHDRDSARSRTRGGHW